MSVKFYSLKVEKIVKETPDCVSVQFELPENLKSDFVYKPGQYLTLRIPGPDEDIRRSYSICSGKNENVLKVAIKKVDGGRFSTFANDSLKVGDVLDVMSPMGNFTLNSDPENKKNYVFLAAGSGITPIMSLIKTILSEEPESSVTLFYGNRRFEDIIFREELEDLKNLHLRHLAIYYIFSKEKLGSPLFYGRIDGEKFSKFAKALIDVKISDVFMLCGPAEMIFSVRDKLIELGVDTKKIHFELFNTDGAKTHHKIAIYENPFNPDESSRVRIKLDDDFFDFSLNYGAENILDAALKNGADLPFACKGGVCSTCKAKLIQGEVEMDINYALEPDELAAGYILTCQSHPRSAEIFVDFDQK
jgi:ring-1,2-phenylacetyl-CoA epoxidase subunit PaaE